MCVCVCVCVCERERERERQREREGAVNNRNKINSFHCFISILDKCVVDRNLAATHIWRGAEIWIGTRDARDAKGQVSIENR